MPTAALLRWDLTLRILLSVAVPLTLGGLFVDGLAGMVPALVAALVSLSYLGPDLGDVRWAVIPAVAAPVAMGVGAALSPAPWPFPLTYVFVLYTFLGAFMLAGLIAQLAFAPVASVGLIAAVLIEDGATLQLLVGAALGALWALLLIVALPRLIRYPALPVPPGVLAPRAAVLQRMLTRPRLRDWGFPLLLGLTSAVVLVVATIVTDNSRPYWSVFAFVSVLGPAAAETRAVGWETVAASVGGVLLAIFLVATGLSDATLVTITLLLGLVGALYLLKNGVVSKLLLTPLPIILIALALAEDPSSVASLRLFEYLFGAGAALLVASIAEWLALRLEENRPEAEATLAG